jgi:hypothetical protein
LPNEAEYGLLNRGGEFIMDKKVTEKETMQNQPLVHDFNKKDSLKSAFTPKAITVLLVIVLVGVVSGFLFSNKNSVSSTGGSTTTNGASNSSSVAKGTIVGSNDTATFKDTAEGTLKNGGIDGEGAFHLERPGGDSQSVYMTSGTVDLSKFVDKKIKVWGQTQKAQHAGWLMDVGRIEVL